MSKQKQEAPRLALNLSLFEMPKKKLGLGVSYTFDICTLLDNQKVGEVSLRLGESKDLYYLGHIGYHIDPPFRGHNYAHKACLLLIPLLEKLGIHSLVITADVDNMASRHICEKLGAVLERQVQVPREVQEKYIMDRDKCRYVWVDPQNNKV